MTVMVCTAVLTGALLVGDSVRAGLRRTTALRLGRIQYSLLASEHPFEEGLARRIGFRTEYDTAAVLMTDGMLERPDGTLRVNRVRVIGVDKAFFELSTEPHLFDVDSLGGTGGAAANESLWQRLGGRAGDYVLRVDDPSALSRDLIFSSEAQSQITLRIRVERGVADESLGQFGLAADQQSPLNLFVPRTWLAEKLEVEGKSNLILAAGAKGCPSSVNQMNRALAGVAELEDFGLRLIERPETGVIELQTERLFIPDAAGAAARACGVKPVGIFTYFVNSLVNGQRATPYSMVAAIGGEELFDAMGDDEIILNEWLADDLQAEPGDALCVAYFAISPTNTLIEQSRTFRVRQIVPMLGFASDASLMPAFPGLADAENCANWDPAIPIDLSRIREKDEAYWERYRGTPKAFVSLEAGQKLWENRFGNLTAVRWPMGDNTVESLRKQLMEKLEPEAFGLFFEDIGLQGQRAGTGSTDFGGLFAGLSMFLIAACAIILGLIFGFTVEQRSGQAGILLATGWGKGKIYRLLLCEGAILAAVGSVVGAGLGIVYTLAMMHALRTVWQDAVAGAALQFYWNPMTTAVGGGAGFLICVIAMGLGLVLRLKKTPIELMSNTPNASVGRFSRIGRIIRLSLLGVCGALFAASFYLHGAMLSDAGFFFLNGSILLAVFVLAAMEMMYATSRLRRMPSSLMGLVVKTIIRRPGRSAAVFLTVACGVFMTLGVGLNRKSPSRHRERDSGTGGFALWVETALPLSKRPDAAFAKEIGFDESAAFVALRQRRGDDASCLNLNRAQTPTLLGVRPEDFAQREAFSFREAEPSEGSAWTLLSKTIDDTTIPAIGDYATVYWGLGLQVGDTLAMQDGRGLTLNLRIVGILKESVFQGRLIIHERDFIERFASAGGYNVLLADANNERLEALATALSRKLGDYGAEVMTTEVILREFMRVENTYLTIFLALGGLGLVLGSTGAGLTLLFNVLDRRGELAMMQAMGFSKRLLHRLLMAEHIGLFAAGVLAGGCSAIVAVLPNVLDAGSGALVTGLILPAVIFVSGTVWVVLAGRAAMKRDLLESLRNE